MQSQPVIIFDFDSTLVKLESLDELAALVLADAPDGAERVKNIQEITHAGMVGEIGFEESLSRRFAQIQPHKSDVERMVKMLHESISDSVQTNLYYLHEHADDIWIISGGFKDFIDPVATYLGISPDHVIANQMVWDSTDCAVGYDQSSPLAHDNSKVTAIAALGLPTDREIVMVGDGMTDYAVYEAGLATKFVAYTENVRRDAVVQRADYEARSFDDLLQYL